LLPGYFFARSIGDFSVLSSKQWLGILVLILLLTAIFTIAGIRMQGRSGKERRERRRTIAAE
jgi:preprotein translocase subunit YajC